MTRAFIPESPSYWDAEKASIIGEAPPGIFDRRFRQCRAGDLLPGEWWRAEENGRVVGYGWLDVSWGDAEILLATAPSARGRGIGTFILDHLEGEARARGLNYLYNLVRPTHPDGKNVTAWLVKRGFRAADDGNLLRAVGTRAH
jgi:N-acetylglutamate synthase-like GNAT family acetyltransferase